MKMRPPSSILPVWTRGSSDSAPGAPRAEMEGKEVLYKLKRDRSLKVL